MADGRRLPRGGARLAAVTAVLAAMALSASAQTQGACEGIESLVQQLGSRSANGRDDARGRLRAMGTAVVPCLILTTDADDAVLRWEAVNLLGLLGDPRATDAILRVATTDPDVHARWRANWALARLDDGTVVPRLIEGLTEEDPTVAWNAAVALSLFGATEAVPVLHRGLNVAGWRQWEAVNALGRVWNDETPAKLIAVLSRAPEDVRKEAVLSLGRIGGRLALEGLLDALRTDPSPEVRWRAAMMLGRIGSKEIAGTLMRLRRTEEDGAVLAQIDRALERTAGSS